VDKHHELAKKATAKYLAAGKYLTEHEEEQPQIAQLYLKAKAKVVEMSLKLIRYDDLQITPEAYAELVKRMSAAKLIERIPEYEDFVDRTLLP
jgi:NitT/TauT family transport system substrate-binding protein